MVIALSGCTSGASPTSPTGWTPIQTLATGLSPQERVAASAAHDGVVTIWHDSRQLTLLNLKGSDNTSALKKLPLGHTPRQWMLFNGNDDSLQVLWLDQADLPGETRLYAANIAPDLSLQRGPTMISTHDTLDAAAIPLASGALLTLWTVRTSNPVTPLYMQLVDAQGRPRPAVLIAKDAVHPALAHDTHGNLYASWLEPQSDHLWAIEYVLLPPTLDAAVLADNMPPVPTATAVGLIVLAPGRALESFGLGTDASSVYCIWGDTDVINGFDGRVQALSFPSANPAKVTQFTVADHARWPSIPVVPGTALSISLTSSQDTHILIVGLLPGRVGHIESFSGGTGVPGQTALIRGNDGSRWLIWPIARDDGSTVLEETHMLPGS